MRRQNGPEEAWKVKYWGVGNESWGCEGSLSADYYADPCKRCYATYCRNYGENRPYKVAGGPNAADYNWTETLLKKIPANQMRAISLHYYTVNWRKKESATQVNN